MGQQAARDVVQSMGLVPDSALQRYVSSLGKKLAATSERPGLPWQFAVVEDPAVNAFALPGGPVFITRGILSHMNSEAQLVSVLGHEIGHITAKHSVSQISKAQLAQLGFGVAMIARPELQRFGDLAELAPAWSALFTAADAITQVPDDEATGEATCFGGCPHCLR